MSGTLNVTVVGAKLKRDMDLFSKQDPYVIMMLDGIHPVRTTVQKRKGLKPVWNELYSFRCFVGQKVTFDIYDRDRLAKDDFISQAYFNVRQTERVEDTSLSTYYKNAASGILHVRLEFIESDRMVEDMYDKFSQNKEKGEVEDCKKFLKDEIKSRR